MSDYVLSMRMMVALMEGHPTEAESLSRTLQRQWSAHGFGAEAAIYSGSAQIQEAREKIGLEPLIESFRSSLLTTTEKPDAIQAMVALALAEAGRMDEAWAIIDERGSNEFRDIPDDASLPVAHSFWAEAIALCGHQRRARCAYDRLLVFADLHQVTGGWYLGATARYLALLCAALGRNDEADTWFSRAEREHESMKSPTWVAGGRLDWAESLLFRRDSTSARDMASRALATIGDLKLDMSRARAERILELI